MSQPVENYWELSNMQRTALLNAAHEAAVVRAVRETKQGRVSNGPGIGRFWLFSRRKMSLSKPVAAAAVE